jgi:tetratricopeptide (TPR) repeat protein
MYGLIALLIFAVNSVQTSSDTSRSSAITIVKQIQWADYEGDRAALKHLHGKLTPFLPNQEIAARVRYWRGFALWRRAINGFNDNANSKELEEDLTKALEEFNDGAKLDPGFGDAKVGALGCVSLIGYLHRGDAARLQELIAQARQLRKDVEATTPENPRFLWVLGPNVWNTPPERGGGQAKAMEMYEKGLEVIRKNKAKTTDPLEPSWGEPELLMNLAYSNLHRTKPDLNAAEQHAQQALALVPYWHYVRDILLPQIRKATISGENP